jgi:hypothetical protein
MNVKKTAKATKKFVSKHRVAIAVVLTATAVLTLNKHNINEMNDFLKAHDLFDEYWKPEDE